MSGSRRYSTSDASEKPERNEVVLSLVTVQKMLPLVNRITNDILASRRLLNGLHPEEAHLDRQKRTLDWPQRKRRYEIKETLLAAEQTVQAARTELHELGLAVLEEGVMRIGFPTLVNNRRAYFTWNPGEESLKSWQFADDDTQRQIPTAWLKEIHSEAGS